MKKGNGNMKGGKENGNHKKVIWNQKRGNGKWEN